MTVVQPDNSRMLASITAAQHKHGILQNLSLEITQPVLQQTPKENRERK